MTLSIEKLKMVMEPVPQELNCEVFMSKGKHAGTQTLLTFIVTCYSEDRLSDVIELIESIFRQTYGSKEVVLIVERNRNLFLRLVSYYESKSLVRLKLVHCDMPLGLSLARNLGLKFAIGKIIAFVDDDVTLEPGWVAETVRTYRADDTIIGVTGKAIPILPGDVLDWFPRRLHWLIGSTASSDVEAVVEVRNAFGMNMSFKREVFDIGQRFQESFGMRSRDKHPHAKFPSEDVDLSIRARFATGGKIVYNPRVCVRHKVELDKLSLKHLLSRAFFLGRQRRMIEILYRDLERDPLQPEKALLKLILGEILVGTFGNILKRPFWAVRRICITTAVLCSVGLGYVSYIQPEETSANPLLGKEHFSAECRMPPFAQLSSI